MIGRLSLSSRPRTIVLSRSDNKKMVTYHLCDVRERHQYCSPGSLQSHLAQVHNIAPQDCLPFNNALCAFRNFTVRYDMHLH